MRKVGAQIDPCPKQVRTGRGVGHWKRLPRVRTTSGTLPSVALPMLLLVRLADSTPTDLLAGLTIYCALACGASVVVRRFVGLTLPAALVVVLVNVAPLIALRQRVASSDPSTR